MPPPLPPAQPPVKSTSELTVEFTESPLGLRFDGTQYDDGTHVVQVAEITRKTEATARVKPGFLLRRINELDVTNLSLPRIQRMLMGLVPTVSRSKPITIVFLDPTNTGPLFEPFLEPRSQSQAIYTSDQKAAMTDASKVDERITTLPSPEGGAAVPPSRSTEGSGSGGLLAYTASLRGPVLGPMGGLVPDGGGSAPSTWLNANDVINVNDLRKRIINIDSEFRTDIRASSSHFFFRVDPPIKNAIRIRMASIEIQNTFYLFSKQRMNTTFRLTCPMAGTDYVIEISGGNYTATTLVNAIQAIFDQPGMIPKYQISLNSITGLITITNTHAVPFSLDFRTEFNECMPFFWGLGYNLGYRDKYYAGGFTYTGDALVDTVGDMYLFLQINNFNNVEQRMVDGEILYAFAKIVLRDNKFTKVFDDNMNFLTKEIIFPQPVNISNLEIRLVDRYGNLVDNLQSEWSMALEVTDVMNARLYDFYRNYLFQKDVKF